MRYLFSISIISALLLFFSCKAQLKLEANLHEKINIDSLYNVLKNTDVISSFQPRILKIDVIGLDTLVLVESNTVFMYKNGKFDTCSIDSKKPIDFSVFKSGATLITSKTENKKYLVFSKDKSINYLIEDEPRLVDESKYPAFITSKALYIFDTSNTSPSIYKVEKKSFPVNERDGATAIFKTSLFITTDYGEFGGEIVEFDYKHNQVKVHNIPNVNSSLIVDDSLFFISSLAHLGGLSGSFILFDNDFKNIVSHSSFLSPEERNKPHLSSFRSFFYNQSNNEFIIGMYEGFAIIKNNKVEKIIHYDFDVQRRSYRAMNYPCTIKLFGDKIYAGSYRGGLYIFDYNTFSLLSRHDFTLENLISIGYKKEDFEKFRKLEPKYKD